METICSQSYIEAVNSMMTCRNKKSVDFSEADFHDEVFTCASICVMNAHTEGNTAHEAFLCW